MIAYRTNLVVMVPKAFRTFHDQCPVHGLAQFVKLVNSAEVTLISIFHEKVII